MRMKFFATRLLCLLCLLLSACATGPTHTSLVGSASSQAPRSEVIPTRMFVADWDGNGAYQLSPDGQQLSWSARKGFGQGLFVKNLQTGVIHSYANFGAVSWAQDSQHVLFGRSNGNENGTLFALDTFSEEPRVRWLTQFSGGKFSVQSQVRGSMDLVISGNQRDARVFDLYRRTWSSGAFTRIALNPGDVSEWLTNSLGQVIARVRVQGDGQVLETPVDPAHTQWQAAFSYKRADQVKFQGVSADGHALWALSNRGRDRLALVQIDLASGVETLVFAAPQVDISSVVMDAQAETPLAVRWDLDYPAWKFFDPGLELAALRLQGNTPGRLDILSISRDHKRVTATVMGLEGGQHRMFDAAIDHVSVLGDTSLSRMQAYGPLPEQTPVPLRSRDGLDLHAYLTMPAGGVGKNLPTVLFVHGGPWAQDTYLSDFTPLFLANRGYAVLQLNFRGSAGYGRVFEAAGHGEFAAKMQDDLLDGLDYLIAQGITDPRKVAIMGASYGGYASLVGMTQTPERFACGISVVGISDLPSFMENIPTYWELDGKPRFIEFVGDPQNPEDRARMQAKSPLNFADKVRGPILLLHGANDPRVKLDQSERMAAALRHAGKAVDLHVFPNAGHGPDHWTDKLTYFRKTENFLAQCLGGRSYGFDYFELGKILF